MLLSLVGEKGNAVKISISITAGDIRKAERPRECRRPRDRASRLVSSGSAEFINEARHENW